MHRSPQTSRHPAPRRHVHAPAGLAALLALLVAEAPAAAQPTEAVFRCMAIGDARPEPVGDREHHAIHVIDSVCAGEGFAQGVVQTGTVTYEWDGPRAKALFGHTVSRRPGAFGVSIVLEARSELQVADGKVVGGSSSGRGQTVLATGDLAPVHGRSFSFSTRIDGPGRWTTTVRYD